VIVRGWTTGEELGRRARQPGSVVGLLYSTANVVVPTVITLWVLGVTWEALSTFSLVQYLGGVVGGIAISWFSLWIEARPELRERFQNDLPARIGLGIVTAGSLGILLYAGTEILVVMLLVWAGLFVPGRVGIFLVARKRTE
jgi:hypothetical protein